MEPRDGLRPWWPGMVTAWDPTTAGAGSRSRLARLAGADTPMPRPHGEDAASANERQASFADRVIVVPVRAWLTGQFCLASWAAASN